MQFAFCGGRTRLGLITAVIIASLAWLAVDASAGTASRHGHAAATGHPTITSRGWGTANGQAVRLWTLRSGHGMTVNITNYGGVVQSIWVPGRNGREADVALGFPRLSDYVNDFQHQPWPAAGGSGDTYFGAIIGRYANRIAFDKPHNHAGFTLNGTFYPTPENNGQNTLHGGPDAYNTKVWAASTKTAAHSVSLVLRYTDPDGYNGFPGAVSNTVTYTLTDANALVIHYVATTTKPTVVNFTNHTYFNLAGQGSGPIYGQRLQINANQFQPTNNAQIPTGFASVAGTPFDFRHMKAIGRDIERADMRYGHQLVVAHGYDHNWVLGRPGSMKLAAIAVDPGSGRELLTYTTEPGVQLYTSNFLVGDLVGTTGQAYRQGQAFTLETQHYPDTPHHIGQAGWPSVVLNPGHTFKSTTIYQFAVAQPPFAG